MSSITSEASVRSSDESNPIDSEEADLWTLWGKLLNEWESMTKKSSLIIKVRESKRKATTSILIKIIVKILNLIDDFSSRILWGKGFLITFEVWLGKCYVGHTILLKRKSMQNIWGLKALVKRLVGAQIAKEFKGISRLFEETLQELIQTRSSSSRKMALVKSLYSMWWKLIAFMIERLDTVRDLPSSSDFC